jgi:hypothetical protein
MMRFPFLCCFLLLSGILIAGCASPVGTGQGAAPAPSPGPSAAGPADFSHIAGIDVVVIGKDWDSVPGNDGILIYPDLKDVNQQSILWEGTPLPTDVEIWSAKSGGDQKETKDQLIYRGSDNITSWRDGKILMGGGIRIPFTVMKVPEGKTTGMTYVTVHTPEGKTYTGYSGTTPLIP